MKQPIRYHLLALVAFFLAVFTLARSAHAQDVKQIDQIAKDLQILLHSAHGMEWPDSSVEDALQRARNRPGYLNEIRKRLLFPERENLWIYPQLIQEKKYDGLLSLTGLIGTKEASGLVSNAYLEIMDDLRELNKQSRQCKETQFVDCQMDYPILSQAQGSALHLHNLSLTILGDLKDASVKDSIKAWHAEADYGSKMVIEQYLAQIKALSHPPNTAPTSVPPGMVEAQKETIKFLIDQSHPYLLTRKDSTTSEASMHIIKLQWRYKSYKNRTAQLNNPSETVRTAVETCRSYKIPSDARITVVVVDKYGKTIEQIISDWSKTGDMSLEDRLRKYVNDYFTPHSFVLSAKRADGAPASFVAMN